MRLLAPLEELEALMHRLRQSRRKRGRLFTFLDCMAVLLAGLCLAFGAAFCFAPLHTADYAPVGNFSLQEQTGPVNVNTAGVQALCSLPGIGEKRAQRIRDYIEENGRFATLEEVANVPGISAAMVEKWQGLAVTE